jgi:galactose oxidase
MTQERWYNVSQTRPDGRVFTLGGNRTSGGDGNGEIYDPATNTWTALPAMVLAPLTAGAQDISRAMEHPRLFVAPDGRTFVPGPTPNMQWYDFTKGTVTLAAVRGDDEFSQNDVTVMYDVAADGTGAKFLKAGGNINYDRTNATYTPASRNSYTIALSTGSDTPVVTKIAPMKYPRSFANGVVAPDGRVYVFGGNDNGKGFSDDGGVRATEVFDPATASWRELPSLAKTRPYHSWALLLPDARIMVGGGGLCSTDTCAVNHPDIEIFSPPYLFEAARPAITSPPSTITANGGSFPVTVSGAVTGFALVRMASVTHTVDTDQRRMVLIDTTGTGDTRMLTGPANSNVAPPGYYMLFALAGDVPSVGQIVQVN